MFSLIRKISNSQQPKDSMDQPARADKVEDKHEDEQQEEVDSTSYDPDADPWDPGSYYSFPQFTGEKQEEDVTSPSPGTPCRDEGATHREPGPSDQDSDLTSNHTSTPISKSSSPSSSEADQVSPPFWPTSPLSKRLRYKPSPAALSPLPLQRRSTTSSSSSPQLSRVQSDRRTSGSINTQHKSPSSKYHSSPAARSLRSISAAQSPSRKSEQQRQRRVSAHSQGTPGRDSEKTG